MGMGDIEPVEMLKIGENRLPGDTQIVVLQPRQ
jgi:hypothetical protein